MPRLCVPKSNQSCRVYAKDYVFRARHGHVVKPPWSPRPSFQGHLLVRTAGRRKPELQRPSVGVKCHHTFSVAGETIDILSTSDLGCHQLVLGDVPQLAILCRGIDRYEGFSVRRKSEMIIGSVSHSIL